MTVIFWFHITMSYEMVNYSQGGPLWHPLSYFSNFQLLLLSRWNVHELVFLVIIVSGFSLKGFNPNETQGFISELDLLQKTSIYGAGKWVFTVFTFFSSEEI